jgi:hypothetical protein
MPSSDDVDEYRIPAGGLAEQVARAKHRWFKRVAYDQKVGSSEKVFAFVVMDHLNCATLDSWPAQKTIAAKLGWCTKTIQRIARALEAHGHIRIRRRSHGSYRYAPVFSKEDEDKSVSPERRECPPIADKNVDQSFLGILPNKSTPRSRTRGVAGSVYDPQKRGYYESELAKKLGKNGFEILARLSDHDDALVDRLCRAWAKGEVGARELLAVQLAVQQLERRRKPC